MATVSSPEVYKAREAELEHSSRLLESLLFLRDVNHYQDSSAVIFECQGGEELRGHRLILCAASPYLRELEGGIGLRTVFKTIPRNDVKVVLDFMYTGKIYDEENVKRSTCRLSNVLNVASFLKVDVLVKWCFHRLADSLNICNCQEVYQFAEEYNSERLLSGTLTFMAEHFHEMFSGEDYRNLTENQLMRITRHPSVTGSFEDLVKNLIRWVEADAVNRKDALKSFIISLDLSNLSNEYLSLLLRCNIVKRDGDVRSILTSEVAARAVSRSKKSLQMNPSSKLVEFGRVPEGEHFMIIYDVNTDEQRSHAWTNSRRVPFNINDGVAVAGFENHVYFFGGGSSGDNPRPSTSIIKYAPVENCVHHADDTLLFPVHSAGACQFNDVIYIINGVDIRGIVVCKVQCYSPVNGTCHLRASTVTGHKSPHVASVGVCVYVVGSEDGVERSVERYDSITDQWTIVTRIPVSCRSRSHAAIYESKIFIVDENDMSYVYHIGKNEWDLKIPRTGFPILGLWTLKKNGQPTLCVWHYQDFDYLMCYDPDTWQWPAPKTIGRPPRLLRAVAPVLSLVATATTPTAACTAQISSIAVSWSQKAGMSLFPTIHDTFIERTRLFCVV